MQTAAPSQGQLVQVRRRQFLVQDVQAASLARDALSAPQHCVRLSSVDEDALGEELEVVWEIEPGARILHTAASLPEPAGFDDPIRFDAFLDAVRWGAIDSGDPNVLQSPFRAGIQIEDYQIDPVARALRMPRVNLLIADDVGLGKTIEAGLVVEEMMLRHRVRTVLVITPASVQIQWRDQMRDKFGLEFRIVDTELLRDLRRRRGVRTNPWTHFPRLITSIDFVKREENLRRLREVLPDGPTYPRRFDLLIVDEAHNVVPSRMSRYSVDTDRTRAVRLVAQHFEHKLFLTATPHNGFRESWSALLNLLDDQRFAPPPTPPDPKQVEQIVVRRLKSQLIDKDGRPEERARSYPDVFHLLKGSVKAERAAKARDVAAAPWWQFWRARAELYATIAGMQRVLVRARVSNLHSLAFVPKGVVMSEATVVFAFDSMAPFALLQSNAHALWIDKYASSMRTDVRYTPTDCFDTFPSPKSFDSLEAIGERYHSHRAACCQHFDEGLTKVANRLHDPAESSPQIRELRDLHAELDRQVLAAYGWSDLRLDHDFRCAGLDTRFTVSDPIRQELLDRLLKLNHQRHAEEEGAVSPKRGKGPAQRPLF